MHRWQYLLGLGALSLVGCSHEEHGYSHGGQAWSEACEFGVSFNLDGIQERLDKNAPATIRACFDDSCDELTLFSDTWDRQCKGAPGGPPDQLTWCEFSKTGTIRVSILRVDDQDYSSGRPHTAAISVKNPQGERIYAHAEVVRFDGGSCSLQEIRLAQPETSRPVE